MDQPICGFVTLDGMCREPREDLRCGPHSDPVFLVCVGCAGQAHKQCQLDRSDLGRPCGASLCLSCVHNFTDERGHHHALPENVTVGDFASSQKRVARDVRQELIEVIADAMRENAHMGRLTLPSEDMATVVGSAVLDALTIHITLKLLSGMAGS